MFNLQNIKSVKSKFIVYCTLSYGWVHISQFYLFFKMRGKEQQIFVITEFFFHDHQDSQADARTATCMRRDNSYQQSSSV